MSSNFKHYTATDIARYHNGQLAAVQMHAMELQALEDPILADAMDGFAQLPNEENMANINWLQSNLPYQNTNGKVIEMPIGKAKFNWKKIAIAASIVGVAITFGALVFNNKKQNNVAANNKVKTNVQNNTAINDTSKLTNESNTTTNLLSTNETVENNEIAQLQKPNTAFVKPDALEKYYQTGQIAPVIVEQSLKTENKKDIVIYKDTVVKQSINDDVVALQKPAPSVQKIDTDKFKERSTNSSYELKTNEPTIVQSNTIYNNSNNNNAAPKAISITYDFAIANKKENTNIGKSNYNNYLFNYKVVDAQGNNIPFTNISVPADQLITYSRVDGRFGLFSSDSILSVVVKAAGYQPKKLSLSTTNNYIPIVLQTDATTNTDVVVVGNSNNKIVKKSGKLQSTIEEAEPIDGIANYDTYIVNNININDKPKGEVVLSFDVDKTGEPTNIKIDKSLSSTADEEAIRLVTQGPKWKAKKRKNKTGKIIIRF